MWFGSLFHIFVTLLGKNFKYLLVLTRSLTNLSELDLVMLLLTVSKDFVVLVSYLPLRILYASMRSPLIRLNSRLGNCSARSLSSYFHIQDSLHSVFFW